MAKIYDDPSTTENEDELFNGKGGGDNSEISIKTIGIIACCVLFILMPIPIIIGLLIAWGAWAVFRWIHIRASVITVSSIIAAAISFLLFSITFKLNKMPELIRSIILPGAGDLKTRIMTWLSGTSGLIWLGIAIGFIAGSICCWVTRAKIHNNPYLVVTKGEKYYHWRYRHTPKQMLARITLIKQIKDDALNLKGGYPLGIEEEPINPPDDPAYIKYDTPIGKYDSEAFTHTILTGASGSGKELRWDTMIPTINGFKLMRDIQPGDVLFDEHGMRTKVLAKYHPNTPDHYEVHFSDGTVINAGGDHLWQVNHVGKRRRTGRSLMSMYSDSDFIKLRKIIANINVNTDNLITTEQAVQKHGNWIKSKSSAAYNQALSALVYHKPLYDIHELIDKIQKTGKLSDSEKKNIIHYINNDANIVNNHYVNHDDIMHAMSNNSRLIVELTRYIHDRTYSGYNEYEYYNALIQNETMRRARINDIMKYSRKTNARMKTSMLQTEIINTRTMYENIMMDSSNKSLYSITVTDAVQYDYNENLPVKPYTMGAWLGDGSSHTGMICGIDYEVRDNIIKDGYEFINDNIIKADGKTRHHDLHNWKFKNLKHDLFSKTGLIITNSSSGASKLMKDIPDAYMMSSVEQRMRLLSGLLDTDGCVDKHGRVEICMTNESIVRKMRAIVCSLGWIPTRITTRECSYTDAGHKVTCMKAYRFSFHPDGQVFNVKHKADRLEACLHNGGIRRTQRYITSIIPKHDDVNEDYYCLTVDSPNHLFLCSESFIPTHNTITMQNDIYHKMQQHQTVFIIDCKADPVFASKMAAWCDEMGANFYHFAPTMGNEYRITQNPAGPAFYDPLSHGRAAEHTDMLISTREWDAASAVYKSNAQSMLSTVFAIMDEMDKNDSSLRGIDFTRGNMYTFYELIRNENNLTSAINTVPASSNTRLLADELETLIHATNRQREAQGVQNAMGEYKGFMRGLMSSDGKYMIYPGGSTNRKIIDIFKLASEPNNVVLFSISATKNTDIGAMVGSMICTDLTNMTAMRAISGQTNPVSIYVDEFQSLPPTSVKSMLEKARSAKIGITLAFQSLDQVTASSGSSAFINALLDTCGNFIFHAGANEATAQIMSQIVGKHWTNSYTIQRRNQQGMFEINFGNKRNANVMTAQVEKYIIEPSEFQHLSAPRKENGFKSEAIVIKKASSDEVDYDVKGAVAHKVWMIPPSVIIADDYFDPNAPIMEFDDKAPETGLPEEATNGKSASNMLTPDNLFNSDMAEQAAAKAQQQNMNNNSSKQPPKAYVNKNDDNDSLNAGSPYVSPVLGGNTSLFNDNPSYTAPENIRNADFMNATNNAADDSSALFNDNQPVMASGKAKMPSIRGGFDMNAMNAGNNGVHDGNNRRMRSPKPPVNNMQVNDNLIDNMNDDELFNDDMAQAPASHNASRRMPAYNAGGNERPNNNYNQSGGRLQRGAGGGLPRRRLGNSSGTHGIGSMPRQQSNRQSADGNAQSRMNPQRHQLNNDDNMRSRNTQYHSSQIDNISDDELFNDDMPQAQSNVPQRRMMDAPRNQRKQQVVAPGRKPSASTGRRKPVAPGRK